MAGKNQGVSVRAYEADFAGWAEDTAQAIREGRWTDIDRAALANEVADLGKQQRQRITSRLEVLFLHLLKARYRPLKHSRSWDLTMKEQRLRAQKILEENPSLKATLCGSVAEAYELARLRAARETGLPLETFPDRMPFTDEEIWG
jgi:hypothetical protein